MAVVADGPAKVERVWGRNGEGKRRRFVDVPAKSFLPQSRLVGRVGPHSRVCSDLHNRPVSIGPLEPPSSIFSKEKTHITILNYCETLFFLLNPKIERNTFLNF